MNQLRTSSERTNSERTPNKLRTNSERTPNELRTNSERTPNELRTNSEKTPDKLRTNSGRTRNKLRTSEQAPSELGHCSRANSEHTLAISMFLSPSILVAKLFFLLCRAYQKSQVITGAGFNKWPGKVFFEANKHVLRPLVENSCFGHLIFLLCMFRAGFTSQTSAKQTLAICFCGGADFCVSALSFSFSALFCFIARFFFRL